MPKITAFRLSWQNEQQTYQLYTTENDAPLKISANSSTWFLWLDQITSFTFHGQHGHCTIRKENRKRGDAYWYAYQSSGKQLSKKYLGKTAQLTTTRLEEITQQLTVDQAPHQDAQSQPYDQLQRTKFSAPHLQPRLVARTRLFQQIDQGIQGPLTLISAPAGFGKTTTIGQWLQQKKVPAAWLSLEPQDNHPIRFLRYVIAAFQRLDPQLGRNLQLQLLSGHPIETESVFTLLAHEISRHTISSILLILDDYHVINSDHIHWHLTSFCAHQTPGLHLVVLTRADPPLQLARLRAYGKLTELRAEQLRFDSRETVTFLQSVMDLNLSEEGLRLLEQRTEGWVAGLQLAALSLRGKKDVITYLRDFNGSNRFILDYLSDEVIMQLSAPVLDFLLHTCMLTRLHDSLCAAMMQRDPAEISGMLSSFEKGNLFVTALDEEGQWYRYHHLFATMLQARLAQSHPERIPVLHKRASIWYEQNGYRNEAMHHALLIQDIQRVVDLLKPVAWSMLQQGEQQQLLEWLEHIPNTLEYGQPLLCVFHAAALAFLTQTEAALEWLHYAEHPLHPEAETAPPGEIATVRMLIASIKGNLDQAERAAELALSQLSPERPFLQRLARGSQALIYARKGKCALAIEILRSIARPQWTVDQAVGLAYLYLEMGHFQKVARICRETIAHLNKLQLSTLPYTGAIYIVLGMVHYERNECTAAIPLLREGIERCKRTGEIIFLSLGYITMAHILAFSSDFTQAPLTQDTQVQELIIQTEELLSQQRIEMFWVTSATPWQLLRLLLAQGNVQKAEQLLEDHTGNEQACMGPDIPYAVQMEARAFAYVHLARQQPARTLELLNWPAQSAEEDRRIYQLVNISLLQCRAYQALQQSAQALTSLEKALHFAEPAGLVRPFLEEGCTLLELLLSLYKQLQSRPGRVPLSFLQTLLRMLGQNVAPPSHTYPEKVLIEPLTRSELEVLKLISAGLSNREIARQMVVEVGTVKWHLHHIYSKLHVHTRTQALLEAQARGLLS